MTNGSPSNFPISEIIAAWCLEARWRSSLSIPSAKFYSPSSRECTKESKKWRWANENWSKKCGNSSYLQQWQRCAKLEALSNLEDRLEESKKTSVFNKRIIIWISIWRERSWRWISCRRGWGSRRRWMGSWGRRWGWCRSSGMHSWAINRRWSTRSRGWRRSSRSHTSLKSRIWLIKWSISWIGDFNISI